MTLFFLTRTSPNLLRDIASTSVCSLTRHIYFLLLLFCLFCPCVYVCGRVCHSTHVGVRGQLDGVGSLLPCRFQGSNSDPQACNWSVPPLSLSPKSRQWFCLFALFSMLNLNLSLPNWISEIANAQTSMREHRLQICWVYKWIYFNNELSPRHCILRVSEKELESGSN